MKTQFVSILNNSVAPHRRSVADQPTSDFSASLARSSSSKSIQEVIANGQERSKERPATLEKGIDREAVFKGPINVKSHEKPPISNDVQKSTAPWNEAAERPVVGPATDAVSSPKVMDNDAIEGEGLKDDSDLKNEQVAVEDPKELTNAPALFYLPTTPESLVNDNQLGTVSVDSEVNINAAVNATNHVSSKDSLTNLIDSMKSMGVTSKEIEALISSTSVSENMTQTLSDELKSILIGTQTENVDLAKRFNQMLSAYNAELRSYTTTDQTAVVEAVAQSEAGAKSVAVTQSEAVIVQAETMIVDTEAVIVQSDSGTKQAELSIIQEQTADAVLDGDGQADSKISSSPNLVSSNQDMKSTVKEADSKIDSVDGENSTTKGFESTKPLLQTDAQSGNNNKSSNSQSDIKEDVKTNTVKEVTTTDKFTLSNERIMSSEISNIDVKKDIHLAPKVSPTAILEQIKEAMLKEPFKMGEHSEMILQLKPEELGKVELKIEVHRDVVIAKFDVSSLIVKETIESSLADLRNSLKDKGFSDMTFDVNVSKEKTNDSHNSSDSRKSNKRKTAIQEVNTGSKAVSRYLDKSLSQLVGETNFEHYA